MPFARVLPMINRHSLIKHGILFTAVLPVSAAGLTLYHSSQSPFMMANKPFESWNNYQYKNQKFYSTIDLSNCHNERPYFEYHN